MGGWKDKIAGKVSFETEGQELIGRIVEIKPTELKVNSYTLLCEGGELASFLGTTVLDRVLANELNSLVKIVYLGSVATRRGFQVKQFQTAIWDEEVEGNESVPNIPDTHAPAEEAPAEELPL